MDEIEMYERISEIEHILMTRQSDPEPPHWLIDDGENGFDEGLSYCLECMKSIAPNGEWGEEWGGGYCYEEDGTCHCEKCGKLLQYSLTDYGVDVELENYAEYPPRNLDDPDECYQLARIAMGVYTDEQKRRFLEIMRDVAIPPEGDE